MTIAKDLKQPPWRFSIRDESQGIFRKLAEGISTRIFSRENVMLSVVKLEPNSTCTVHSHPEEQWGVLLEGECVRIQGDEEVPMKASDFGQIQAGSHTVFEPLI